MTPQLMLREWNACREWLVPALEQGADGATEDEVMNDLLLDRAQIWRGERSALVTMLVAAETPNITVWLGGGDIDDLLALQPGVEAWARQQGAQEARVNGRAGWARALRKTGFHEHDGELRKVL